MKRNPMTDEQLVAQIELLESQSIGSFGNDIAAEQALAMDYYHNRPFGTEEEGRSQVISSDVWDVVEGLTPLVLKPFVSSDDLVKFNPVGPEDEEAAEQESDYINYVVTQKNDVFETLVSWVKTGLLQKNGIVKYWWDKSQRKSIERYSGLSDDVYATLLQDRDLQVIEHTENPAVDETGPTHDVVVRITHEHGDAKYCVIPPEEFRISRDATSANPKAANFVEHATYKTISAIRQMGYAVEDDISDQGSDDPRTSLQYQARHQDSTTMQGMDMHGNDPSMREVLFREAYMLVDFDGDGEAELRKVCVIGTTILENEETEETPFCSWTPYLQSFTFHGKCPADEATELQLIKSTLLRQTMDNIYGINNNRVYIGAGVNVDDLIDNEIGGFIRFDGNVNEQVREAAITPINEVTMPMVEYFDSAKENRTGFTRYNQGTDSNSLNKTATGIRIISEAGNERVGLTSRSFAELGLKPLMLGIHGLCRRHSTKSEVVKLRGKWVTVNPRDWKTRYDMTVAVGLGTSDKTMQMQGAQLLLDKQVELKQLGSTIVTDKNLYASSAKLAQAVGEKNPDKFFTAPPDEPQPPPNPMDNPEVMLKTKELKQKDEELALKKSQFDHQVMSDNREFKLKSHESERTGLESHARLEKEIHGEPPQSDTAPTDAAPTDEPVEADPALDEIKQGQQTLADAFMQFMQQSQEQNAAILAALEDGNKPKTLRIQKQAEGVFTGVRESMKE